MPDIRTALLIDVYICVKEYTRGSRVRTNIDIDDDLMRSALDMTGLHTKREVVELGLRTLVRLRRQEQVKDLRGRLTWKGDLDELRTDR